MKLHCFFNMHPIVLFLYYFFFVLFIFHCGSLVLLSITFFAVALLNYFCGCIRKTLAMLKYFFAFAILIFISNFILSRPDSFYSMKNFFALCISIILFFSFNVLIDGTKFIYLFGKISPSLALILNICVRYISLFECRMREFIDIYSRNNNCYNKFRLGVLCVTKIFDWAISDCLAMSQVLRTKNFTGAVNSYKAYKFNSRDITFLLAALFLCICIFIFDERFLIFYLFLPFASDFFCWLRFCVRRNFL